MLTFEGNDFTGRIHDRRISRDGSPDGIGGVIHVDDNHLCRVAHLLPDTDELVRLHGDCVEADIVGIDPHCCELFWTRKKSNEPLAPMLLDKFQNTHKRGNSKHDSYYPQSPSYSKHKQELSEQALFSPTNIWL